MTTEPTRCGWCGEDVTCLNCMACPDCDEQCDCDPDEYEENDR